MNTIYKVVSGEYVVKILSELKVSIDYIDFSSRQDISEFIAYKFPKIQFRPDDFLISLSSEAENLLQTQQWVELSQVEQFGWYYNKIHKSQFQLFSATNNIKLRSLFENNPKIKIDSYDKYRSSYRPVKVTNILTGAFGLCYSIFKEEYDNLFRKIKIRDDRWIISLADIDKTDYPILTQIFLYSNSENEVLNKTLLKDNTLKGVRIFSFFLENALEYFINHDYSMEGFLKYLIDEFSKEEELRIFANDFKLLNDQYVKRGISISSQNPITIAVKNFIDLAKTESDKLKNLLDDTDLNKSSIFLLGMLQLGDRIDELFMFDNFIPSLVYLTMPNIIDIKVNSDQMIIHFDDVKTDKNRNKKYEYISKYFKELQLVKDLSDKLNTVRKRKTLLIKVYNDYTSIEDLNKEIKILSSRKNILSTKKENLDKEVEGYTWYNNNLSAGITNENERGGLEKQINDIKKEIDSLNDKKNDLSRQESKLSDENKRIEQEIHYLQFKNEQLLNSKSEINTQLNDINKDGSITKNSSDYKQATDKKNKSKIIKYDEQLNFIKQDSQTKNSK